MRILGLGIWIGLLILSTSCGSNKGEKLVQFGDEALYESDIQLLLGKEEYTDEERDEVIAAWLQTQMLNLFWDSIPEESKKRIDLSTADYRASLIAFEWENLWIERRLDTVVSESELQKYYQENITDFLLNDYIVKLLYIKVPEMAPDLDILRQMYLLKKPTDTAKVTQYANQYSSSFYFNKENWISFEDFVKELPVDFIDVERFVTNKTKQIFEENGFLYLINVLDFRLKNTPSPFLYEKERIKARILLNRKFELRNKAKAFFEQKLKQNDEIQYFLP